MIPLQKSDKQATEVSIPETNEFSYTAYKLEYFLQWWRLKLIIGLFNPINGELSIDLINFAMELLQVVDPDIFIV
jgi:hypothetical protein